MTSNRAPFKALFMTATVGAALLVAIGWCYAQMTDSRSSARVAVEELADCRELAGRIAILRQRPAVAGSREIGAANLARRIEDAATGAGFSNGSVERIDPQPPRRVGETDYREVPTDVRLRHVTLEQLFSFLHALGTQGSSLDDASQLSALHVRNIRISAPRGPDAGDLWTVETTLTYTLYSPKGKDESHTAVAER